jgi:sugar transferase (PEP-CTERM system associated)
MLRVFKQYYPIRNIFFVIGEGIFMFMSVFIVSRIFLGSAPPADDGLLVLKILLVTAVCQACLYYNDLYDFKVSTNFNELGVRLMQALGFAAIFLAFVYILFPGVIIGQWIFSISIATIILLIVSWRFLYNLILDRGMFNEKIVLLGSSGIVNQIKQEIRERKDCGYTLVLECAEPDKRRVQDESEYVLPMIGQPFEGLATVAQRLGVKKIIAGFQEKRHVFPTQELLRCRMEGIEVIEGNSFYEMLTGKLIVEHINPSWLIFSGGFEKSATLRFLRRLSDLVLSITTLICLFPVILLVAVLIKLDSRGPIIFSQERVGERRKTYMIRKFRSMVVDAEKHSGPVWAQDNDRRVTRVGRFIRKTRIDEIPQLWNVFRGEMSFVGPRPEREFFVKDLEKKIPYYRERFTVKPGITGWAQINYGYGATIEDVVEKLNYDLFYIKNMSFWMDLMIVLRTVKIVLFGRGAR